MSQIFKLKTGRRVFSVNTLTGEVRSRKGSDRLRPRCMKVLKHLAEHATDVVTHRELIDRYWNAPVGGTDSLAHVIREIRSVLGDDGQKQQSIVTVPRVGYQFIGSCHQFHSTRQRTIFAAVAVAGFALAAALWFHPGGYPGASMPAETNVHGRDHAASGPVQFPSADRAVAYYDEAVSLLDARTASAAELASALFELAVNSDAGFAPAWAMLAITRSDLVSFHRPGSERQGIARDAASKAMELAPDLPEALTAMALTLSDAEAVNFHHQAVSLGPDHFFVHFYGGWDMRSHRPDLAVRWLERAVEIRPDSLTALVYLGFQLEFAGQFERAGKHWPRVARELDRRMVSSPGSVEVLTFGSYVYQRVNQLDKAYALADRLLRQSAHDPIALVWLGIFYSRENRPDEAMTMLELAVDSGFKNLAKLEDIWEFQSMLDLPRFKQLQYRLEGLDPLAM